MIQYARLINVNAHVSRSRSHDMQHVAICQLQSVLFSKAMTSRAKPKAMATRASTRTTRATAQIETSLPAPTRSARAATAKSSDTSRAMSAKMSAQPVRKSLIRNVSPLTILHRVEREPLLSLKEESQEWPPKLRSPSTQTESQLKYAPFKMLADRAS